MESFKIIEKETKTKAFSKQGLEAARERRDPKEQARDEAREWLNNSVDELQTQIEAFEAEIEALAETKKSKSKSTRPPRLGHLEESMSRHHQHIQRMELVLRLVDNEALQPEDVSDLKELVEDYIDRNQDDFDEFADPEDMYADLELDDLAEAVAGGEVSHDVGKPAVLQKKLEEEGSAGEDSSAGGARRRQGVGAGQLQLGLVLVPRQGGAQWQTEGRVLRRERRRQTRVAGCSEPRQRRQEDPRAPRAEQAARVAGVAERRTGPRAEGAGGPAGRQRRELGRAGGR